MYIGNEKPILNLVKYKYYDSLVSKELITLTTTEILNAYPYLPNPITFKSHWKTRDIRVFYLHLLILNYLKRSNRGLFYDLRAFLFGPFKIKSLFLFFQSLRFLRKCLMEINFCIIIKNFSSTQTEILKQLRARKLISSGDVTAFRSTLAQNRISKVITISTLRDPKLYDLAIACSELNVELHVFVECWDNISTGLGVPIGITKLYLWSEQQKIDFNKFYPNSTASIEICGSYRRPALNEGHTYKLRINERNSSGIFRILYLEGYFYENLNYSLSQIVSVVKSIQSSKLIPRIEIVVRKYPLKRQSIKNDVNLGNQNLDFNFDNELISVHLSNNLDLGSDIESSNLVVSELTTAGLEASFMKIPVIFVGSNASARFLDTMSGYKYSFANIIPRYFNLVNLSKASDLDIFQTLITSLLAEDNKTVNYKLKLLVQDSDIKFFAETFNSKIWLNLI